MNKRITAGAGLSFGIIFAAPAGAQAADFTVTNLSDGPDGGPSGSLRNALAQANLTPEADRILFNSTLSGTLNLNDGPLYAYVGDVEIVGPGARQVTVNGDGDFRILTVLGEGVYGNPEIDADVSGLTLTGGGGDGSNFSFGTGGAILNLGEANLTLSRTTVTGNSAEDGGGIASVGDGVSNIGSVVIEDSTISDNRGGTGGGDYGGGVYAYFADVTVVNSTVSGNSAGEDGGGLYFSDLATGEIRSSTIVSNRAVTNNGGGLWGYGDPVQVRGSIVANNVSDDGGDDASGDAFEFAFSLIEDPVIPTGSVSGPGNITGVDPQLKPLKDNGGPTDTHAFKKSPAKNTGPGDAPNADQRGAPRRGKADIGAYELVKCKGVIVNRVGTAGKDKLKGTKKKDGILGLGGNDKLSGKKGKDGLCGGSGKDKLKGGPGKDKLNGGPGKDKLNGGPGKDKEVQ